MAENKIVTLAEIQFNVESAKQQAESLVVSIANLRKERSGLDKTDEEAAKRVVEIDADLKSMTASYKTLTNTIIAVNDARNNEKITIDSIEKANRGMAAAQKLENLATIEGVQRSNELNAAINKNTQIIKENSSEAKQQALNVGNYGKKFDALGASITQLTREAPAFANSLNTGFMAISNNIPALSDAIGGIIEKNKQLKAEGQPTKSVLSQIASSFLSWNTAISVGVTLLTVYGGTLFKWLGTIGETKKALNAAQVAQTNYRDALTSSRKDAEKDIVHLKLMYEATQNASKSTESRTSAVKEMQKEYPAYFKNMTAEQIMLGGAQKQYEELTQAILNNAKAKALEQKIYENESKKIDLETKQSTQLAYYEKLGKDINAGYDKLKNAVVSGDVRDAFLTAIKKQESVRDQYKKDLLKTADEIKTITDVNKKLADKVDTKTYIAKDTPDAKVKEERLPRTEAYLRELYKTQEDLLDKSLEKEQTKIENNYKETKAKIEKMEAEDTKRKILTSEGKAAAEQAITNLSLVKEKKLKQANAADEVVALSESLERYKTVSDNKLKKDQLDTPRTVAEREQRMLHIFALERNIDEKRVQAGEISQTEANKRHESAMYAFNSKIMDINIAFEEQERKRKIDVEKTDSDNKLAVLKDYQSETTRLRIEHLEEQKQIEISYANKIGADVTLIEAKYSKAKKNIYASEWAAKLGYAKEFQQAATGIASEGTIMAKVVAGTGIVIDTIQGSMKAWAGHAENPILAGALVGLNIAQGISALSKLASVNTDVTSKSMKSGSGLSSGQNSMSMYQSSQAEVGNGIVQRSVSGMQEIAPVQTTAIVIDQVTAAQRKQTQSDFISIS